MVLEFVILDEAELEVMALPPAEEVAMRRAFEKLQVMGEELGFPHSSAVRDGEGWRELRPRRGRSPWRAFYRRWRGFMVVASVGPEALVDPRAFRRALAQGHDRLAAFQEKCREQGLSDL
ncbi:MAG: type II toxin-antitoxin system RelE/ParE family toxin [Armatimonadetes bacterium]|nr:type II toxin-antitoxin system RelE/ParE family toxin [Armatimonadota bacterium]